MANRTRHYESSFTLDDLEITCNTDEDDIGGQLQSLEAAQNSNGAKVTEAIFDKEKDTNLGQLTIKKASDVSDAEEEKAAFKGDAFILSVRTKVLVFRAGDEDVNEDEEEVEL